MTKPRLLVLAVRNVCNSSLLRGCLPLDLLLNIVLSTILASTVVTAPGATSIVCCSNKIAIKILGVESHMRLDLLPHELLGFLATNLTDLVEVKLSAFIMLYQEKLRCNLVEEDLLLIDDTDWLEDAALVDLRPCPPCLVAQVLDVDVYVPKFALLINETCAVYAGES